MSKHSIFRLERLHFHFQQSLIQIQGTRKQPFPFIHEQEVHRKAHRKFEGVEYRYVIHTSTHQTHLICHGSAAAQTPTLTPAQRTYCGFTGGTRTTGPHRQTVINHIAQRRFLHELRGISILCQSHHCPRPSP